MSIRYKTERFFDRYNHFMEFIRTMTGITVLILQVIILKTVFVSEDVKDVEDEYCKTIEFLEKEIEDDKDEIEFLDAFVDESFDLDLTRYQANAIVYYLKAKMAEDTVDMELREYFLREFKKQLEKGKSALKRGPYIVQGLKEMR